MPLGVIGEGGFEARTDLLVYKATEQPGGAAIYAETDAVIPFDAEIVAAGSEVLPALKADREIGLQSPAGTSKRAAVAG